MTKETVLFESEERRSLKEVADFLHQLADKLDGGQVILQQGTESLTLTVPDGVVLEIKVEEEIKKKGIQHSLEVEIEWIEGEDNGGPVTLG